MKLCLHHILGATVDRVFIIPKYCSIETAQIASFSIRHIVITRRYTEKFLIINHALQKIQELNGF